MHCLVWLSILLYTIGSNGFAGDDNPAIGLWSPFLRMSITLANFQYSGNKFIFNGIENKNDGKVWQGVQDIPLKQQVLCYLD